MHLTNTPTIEKRQAAFENFSQEQKKLLLGKGHDYTAGKKDVDAYANFRIIAGLLKGAPITPYTVAMIYSLKHIFSLITFAISGKQESGENLRGRHLDISNYMFILDQLTPDQLNHFERMNPPPPTDADFVEPYTEKFDRAAFEEERHDIEAAVISIKRKEELENKAKDAWDGVFTSQNL